MQVFQIGPNEAGQRFDKFLHKYMPEATGGFLYKMLRKKNITLNGKKAEGKELLAEGDQISFFFSEETFRKFRGLPSQKTDQSDDPCSRELEEYHRAYQILKGIEIIYEDAQVLFLSKPAGILSQKATAGDLSVNEWLIGYLLESGQIAEIALETFKPSVCNRLDRNTSGIVLCGKSLAGSQELSRLIRERKIRKFYRTFVKGSVTENSHIRGYLYKEEKNNRVTVVRDDSGAVRTGFSPIETAYHPLEIFSDRTYLEVELITGKTHQIRAHLASMGHPVLGDTKYGDPAFNGRYRTSHQIKWQLLHAYRVEFPALTGPLEALGGKVFTAPLPAIYELLK